MNVRGNVNRINRSRLLMQFYQILVFNAILNSSLISRVPYFSIIVRYVLLLLVFLGTLVHLFGNKKTDLKILMIEFGFVAISLIVMNESNSRYALILLLFLVIIYRDVDPRQFCRKYVEAAVAAMLFVIILLIVGILPNEYRIEFRHGISSIGLLQYRYNLGFINSTVPANFAFHISLAFLFYKQDRFKPKDAILILVPTTIIYALTDTKAAYFEGILAILAVGFLKIIKRNWFKRLIGFLSIWLMPVSAFIELYIANNFTTSNPVYALMDKLLTYRLSWVARALKSYDIGLLGNNITWGKVDNNSTYQLVDMFYLRCAIQYGLIFLFVIIIGFMGISAYFKSKGNYYGCAIIMILALHSITDPQLLEFTCVPLLVLLFTGYKYIIERTRRKKERRYLIMDGNL